MFGLETKSALPVDFIEITAVWVRGGLGPLTVWSTTGDFRIGERHEKKDEWDLLYRCAHPPSFHKLQELELDEPLRIKSSERISLYGAFILGSP
jgi:hypothetical protein